MIRAGVRRKVLGLLIGALGGVFSPMTMFGAGEPGVWFDPNDLSTLYQDSAGTMPVTAMEQPVGLALDKSRGGRQADQAVNGYLKSGRIGWTIAGAANWTIQGDTLYAASPIPGTIIANSCGIVAGRTYEVLYYGGAASGAVVSVFAGGTTSDASGQNIGSISGLASRRIFFTATQSGPIKWRTTGAVSGMMLGRLSVREVPGNHAIQPTAINRPVISARRNTYTDSRRPSGGTDGSATGAFTDEICPATGERAYRLTSTNVQSAFYIYRQEAANAAPAGASETRIAFIKPEGATYSIGFETSSNANYMYVRANVLTGVVTKGAGVSNAGLEYLDNGWYKVWATATWATATGNIQSVIAIGTPGDPASILIGGWHREYGLAGNAARYQRSYSATDYDWQSWPKYLLYNGVNQWMYVPTLDMSAVSIVTLTAGLIRNTDSTLGRLCSLGDNGYPIGYFSVNAPPTTTAAIGSSIHGSSAAAQGGYYLTPAAPFTALITHIYDLTATTKEQNIRARLNGVDKAWGSQGPLSAGGTFGKLPFYIGAGNSSGGTPCNVALYGLIVRGALSANDEIAATENWMNQRTGTY